MSESCCSKQSLSFFQLCSYGVVSITIFLSLANKGCSASNTGKKFSLAGRNNYLGFPGQKLTLTWNYTGTEMYKTVVIAVSTPPLDMALKKLWSISYNPKDNTTTVKDLSDSSSLFNEITEIHRTLKVFKLVIKSVPRSLSSFRISCKAEGTSYFDIGEHTASVIVAVAPEVNITINKENDAYVAKGRNVKITCSASGVPTPDIFLKQDDATRKMAKATKSITYTIPKIQPRDAGTYVCEAKNVFRSATNDDVITVRYLDDPAKKIITKVAEMGELELKCPVEGYPRVMYSWYHGETTQLGSARVLAVKIRSNEDFGNYTCRALNAMGQRDILFVVRKNPSQAGRGSLAQNSKLASSLLTIIMCAVLLNWTHLTFIENIVNFVN